jgi:hypothetical protein
VKAENSYSFQKNLVTLMQSQMFKDVKAAAAKDKKKGKKEVPEKKPPTSGVQAKVAVAQRADDGANVAGTKRGP